MEQTAQVRPGFAAVAVRRRWHLIVACALLGLGAGAAATTQLTTTYTSESTLLLQPLAGNPYSPEVGSGRADQLAALQTEAQLMSDPRVAELARARSTQVLSQSAVDDLAVGLPSNTQLLQITFTAPTAATAAAGAQAFADAYLEYRVSRATASDAAAAARITVQLTAATAAVEEAQGQLDDADPDSDATALLESRLGVYAEQEAELRLELAGVSDPVPSPGEIVSPASTPASSALPPWALLAAGLLAGLVLGVVAALAREHADDRLRKPDELTAIGVGRPLAAVSIGVGAADLDHPVAPGYRLLLAGIAARTGNATWAVSVVARNGSVAREVATGLGAAAYRSGQDVMLLGVPRPDRWEEAHLLSADTVADPRTRTVKPYAAGPHLEVVDLDLDDDAAEELVTSPALPLFVSAVRSTGYPIVMSGGRSGSPAAVALSSSADVTVLVVELGKDTFTAVGEMVARLQEAGISRVGLVIATPGRGGSGLLRRRGSRSGSPALPPAGLVARRQAAAGEVGEADPAIPGAEHPTPPVGPTSRGGLDGGSSAAGPVAARVDHPVR